MDGLMIGVSGLRGTVGSTLTVPVVARMAAAFASWLREQPGNTARLKVAFGRDTRPSGFWVRDAAAAALTACGIGVVDLGVVSTPGVAMMTRHINAAGGMIATASHNPIQWNGLKCLDSRGIALSAENAARVKQLYDADQPKWAAVDALVTPMLDSSTHALHVKRVLDHVDILGISTKRFKVVLDSVNGAGCIATATLVSKLGCQFVHLNSTPDGRFAHDPEPTEANLTQLAAEVLRQRAAVGFAQDPDADRLAIVDENGRYIGEEYSLALCAKWVLSKHPGAVVTNLSTSRMVDDIAAVAGSRVLRTPVGEANVVHRMIAENAVFGGEGNGGVIDPRIVGGRDSLVAIAYVLQLMAATGKTVSQLVAEIPAYQIVKTKFPCAAADARRAVDAIAAKFAGVPQDRQDGLRIDWPHGWVHARASNTEPIMRIIAEAADRDTAQKLIDQFKSAAAEALANR